MDQYVASVITAIVAGLFSVLTLIIQKKQDKVINKIDEKTMFIKREKGLRQKLNDMNKRKDNIIHKMMILIMDTNLELLRAIGSEDIEIISKEATERANKLKDEFDKINEEIDDINKEYDLVTQMANEYQKEMQGNTDTKKSS